MGIESNSGKVLLVFVWIFLVVYFMGVSIYKTGALEINNKKKGIFLPDSLSSTHPKGIEIFSAPKMSRE